MGRGSSGGSVKDYYKKRGQRGHGEGSRRRKLSKESAEKRAQIRKERKERERRAGF